MYNLKNKYLTDTKIKIPRFLAIQPDNNKKIELFILKLRKQK